MAERVAAEKRGVDLQDIANQRKRQREISHKKRFEQRNLEGVASGPIDKANSSPVAEIEFTSNFLREDDANGEEQPASTDVTVQVFGATKCPSPAIGWQDPRLPELFGLYASSEAGKSKTKPTIIQSHLWSSSLRGLDALAIAPTGSGKTLAYLLPLACHALGNRNASRLNSPSCLVLGPTRELVAQIAEVMQSICSIHQNLRVIVAYGGDKDSSRLLSPASPLDVLLATPGRCLDLVAQRKTVSLDRVSMLVLDEADRMLQMGLVGSVEAIVSYSPPNHQSILTSATWTLAAQTGLSKWVKPDNHVRIKVGVLEESQSLRLATIKNQQGEESFTTNPLDGMRDQGLTLSQFVEQIVQLCAEHKKPRKLIRHLEKLRTEGKAGPTIVFCNKIKTVLFVYEFLVRQRIRVCSIHGGMPQDKREQALKQFRNGTYDCLVATDVAGRGLDIPNLLHVVNYDFPPSLASYAHRIGRCGREQGKRGSAMSFFTRSFGVMAPDLVKLLTAANQPVDPYIKQLADEVVAGKIPTGDDHPGGEEEDIEFTTNSPIESEHMTQIGDESKFKQKTKSELTKVADTLKEIAAPSGANEEIESAKETCTQDEEYAEPVNVIQDDIPVDDADWDKAFSIHKDDGDAADEEDSLQGEAVAMQLDSVGAVPLTKFIPFQKAGTANKIKGKKKHRGKSSRHH